MMGCAAVCIVICYTEVLALGIFTLTPRSIFRARSFTISAHVGEHQPTGTHEMSTQVLAVQLRPNQPPELIMKVGGKITAPGGDNNLHA